MEAIATGLVTLVSKCHDIASLADTVACSVEDLIGYRHDEPALPDLGKRLREFAYTLEQLQHQLDEPRSISPRIRSSINTSLDDFHLSLAQLQERVAGARATEKRNKDGKLQDSSQLWSPGDIRMEGRALGLQFQTATLLITMVQQDEIERDDHIGQKPDTGSVPRTAASCTTGTTPNPTASRRHTMEIVANTPATTLPRSVQKCQTHTSTTTDIPGRSAGKVRGAAVSTGSVPVPADESSQAPANSNFDPKPPKPAGRAVDSSAVRRKVVRSFTWKMTAKGKQLASQLCQACEENDLEWAKNLLDQGAYVNGHGTSGPTKQRTPLMLAIEHDAFDIAAMLLQSGADLEASGTDKKRPLCLAFEKALASKDSTFQILGLLMANGANVNGSFNSRTLLSNAVSHSRPDLVDFLVLHGASAKDHGLIKVAMMANSSESLEIATSLLRAGAPAGPDPDHNFHPLKHAIFDMASLPWVKLLVTHGANPTIVYKGSVQFWGVHALVQPSPLHIALLSRNHGSILEFILSRKVNVNAECTALAKGNSSFAHTQVVPLHLAPSAQSVHTLMRHGANISSRDSEGGTALFWATSGPAAVELIKALLQHGSPPNARDTYGDTPLSYLCRRILDKTVEELTALEIETYYDSVKVLLEAGARVDVRGRDNYTVLDLVTKKTPKYYDKIPPVNGFTGDEMGARQMYDEIRTLVINSAKKNTRVDDSRAKMPASTNNLSSPSPREMMAPDCSWPGCSAKALPRHIICHAHQQDLSVKQITASAKPKPGTENLGQSKADEVAQASSDTQSPGRPKCDQPSKRNLNVNQSTRIEEFDMKSEYNVF